jgi:hypothetical protein
MTKEYIIEFLEDGYKPYVDDKDIFIIRKNNESNIRFSTTQFLTEIKLIIGEFDIGSSTSINIVSDWVNEKHEELLKELNEFMRNIDATKGSVYFLRIISNEKFESNISKALINKVGIKYYKDKICDPFLDSLVSKYNIVTIKKSSDLISEYLELNKNEDSKIETYVKDKLNRWYCNNVLDGRIKELFSQFVITMGPRTWVVTWVGHGKVSRDKIINNFLEEEENQHDFILDRYDEWYEEEVIDASSRYLGYRNDKWV